MLKKVQETIDRYQMLKQGERVIVGVSGGPDSLTLLHILLNLKEKYSLELFVVHLNHQLRGQEAEQDACFVKAIASKWNLPVIIESRDILAYAQAKKLSIETAAREVRHNLYEQIAGNVGASKIALGHNADDQAETILMRILRGTGEEGLAGIAPVRAKIIRPLLEVNRREIENYCLLNELEFRIDSSNLETIYERNKIRLQLLPLLEKEYNKSIKKSLLRLGRLSRDDCDYWNKETVSFLAEHVLMKQKNQIIINWLPLVELHSAFQRRVLRQAIKYVQGNLFNVSFEQLEDARRFFLTAEQGKKILPSGLLLEKSYNQLLIQKEETKEFCYSLLIPGVTKIPEADLSIRSAWVKEIPLLQPTSSWQVYLLYDPKQGPLEVRTRRAGDRFSPQGGLGEKKLKDFFINQKTPRFLREKIPLLAQNNQILWIIGQRLGESKEKKAILSLKVEILSKRGIEYD